MTPLPIRPAVHIVAIVLLAGLSWSCPATSSESLTVASWGGSYDRACQKGVSRAIHRRDGHQDPPGVL